MFIRTNYRAFTTIFVLFCAGVIIVGMIFSSIDRREAKSIVKNSSEYQCLDTETSEPSQEFVGKKLVSRNRFEYISTLHDSPGINCIPGANSVTFIILQNESGERYIDKRLYDSSIEIIYKNYGWADIYLPDSGVILRNLGSGYSVAPGEAVNYPADG